MKKGIHSQAEKMSSSQYRQRKHRFDTRPWALPLQKEQDRIVGYKVQIYTALL